MQHDEIVNHYAPKPNRGLHFENDAEKHRELENSSTEHSIDRT